jgi:glutamate dehydrogenase
MFLDDSTPQNAYRLETYRSAGGVSSLNTQQLRCYFVTKCHFPPGGDDDSVSSSSSAGGSRTDIRKVSDAMFLEKVSQNTLDIYQEIMWSVERRYGPVMEVLEVEGSRERRMVIGYKMGETTRFFRCVA